MKRFSIFLSFILIATSRAFGGSASIPFEMTHFGTNASGKIILLKSGASNAFGLSGNASKVLTAAATEVDLSSGGETAGTVHAPDGATTANRIATFKDATGTNLTQAAVGVADLQPTNAALTALAGNPNLYQATNAALTALAANPNLYQSTNGTLTSLSTNTVTGTGRIVLESAAGGGGGTTNMMVSTITYGTTISPTFAVAGLSTTAASCRRVTFRLLMDGGNVTTVSAPAGTLIDGDTMVWEVLQDGTGGRTISGWDSGAGGYAFGTDLPSTTLNLSTTADKRDFITFIYNSTANKWYVVGFIKGF